jgi:hypothetical protein
MKSYLPTLLSSIVEISRIGSSVGGSTKVIRTLEGSLYALELVPFRSQVIRADGLSRSFVVLAATASTINYI